MGKRREASVRRSAVLEPDAAGIDIGAEEIYVAVPPDRDEQATRKFTSFTCDLHALNASIISEAATIPTANNASDETRWITGRVIDATGGVPPLVQSTRCCISIPEIYVLRDWGTSRYPAQRATPQVGATNEYTGSRHIGRSTSLIFQSDLPIQIIDDFMFA
jgi:hypothetical protein